MKTSRRAFTGVLALSLLGLAGCASGDPTATETAAAAGSSGPSSSDTITVGSADFSESQLLALIYAHALRGAGITVDEKLNIGSREVYLKALEDGSIDLLPEYSGYLLAAYDPNTTAKDAQSVMAALPAALPQGLEVLTASKAEDQDVLAVTKAFATEHSLTKISDLQPLAPEMVLAGPSEWKERYQGVKGLQELYGLQFKEFKVLDAGGPLTLAALVNGQAQAGDMYSTDPAIAENGLVPLQDDKSLFMPAEVLPVIRTSKASDTATKALDAVSAKLTTDNLMEMNGRVNKGDDLDTIATDWLKAQGIPSA